MTNWYHAAAAPPTDDQLRQLARKLIREAWATGYITDAVKYSDYHVWLVIANEERLNEQVYTWGEENYDRVRAAVDAEVLRMEESVFTRRKNRLTREEDPLTHLRAAIRGKGWDAAKRAISQMTPGGGWAGNAKVEDEIAEEVFRRLYRTIYQPGYVDIENLTEMSRYLDPVTGKRYLKRLSEICTDEKQAEKTELWSDSKLEVGFFRNAFGYRLSAMPKQIEIYRGVPRADVQLRPGEFVTTSRDYARVYMHGRHGAIIRQPVNTDDLLVLKIEDHDRPEFVYYPRAMAEENRKPQDIPPPMSFRQFWAESNQ